MRYSVELKNQAIEMAIEGNKSVAQVTCDLDIKLNTLYIRPNQKWVNGITYIKTKKAGCFLLSLSTFIHVVLSSGQPIHT